MSKNKQPMIPPHMSDLFARHMTDRRAFMLQSAAVAAGATLAGWAPGARAATDNQLEVMAWEGYTLEPELAKWRESKGLEQRTAIMSNQDDVTAKLAGSSPVRLDVAEYSNGYNAIYDELEVLTPIDVAKVPNYNEKDIYSPFYQGDMWHWDQTQWAIPWCWGLDTIVVRPDMLNGVEIKSYEDLLRPELKGKIAFLDNPLTLWPQIAKVAGYGDKFPFMTHDEIDDAFEKLKPYRDQTAVFAASNGDVISLFASGEIAACFCVWSAVPLETQKQGVETAYVLPKEGGAVWVDAWFVPKTSENSDLAHEFINMALTPEVQASVSETAVCSAVQRDAAAHMNAETRGLFDYDNFEAAFSTMKVYGQPPRTSDKYATYDNWLQKWADFRAGF